MVVIDHGDAVFLGDRGIHIVVGVTGVDLDVGIHGLGALDEADQEVVDHGGVHTADEADDGIFVDQRQVGGNGHAGGINADQITHVVLLVGQVQDVAVLADIGVVVEDHVLLLGISGGDFLQVVGHLIGAADDDVILAGLGNLIQVGQPGGLVLVGAAHLDGAQRDAAVCLQLLKTRLSRVEERLVAQVAVDEIDNVVDLFAVIGGVGVGVRGRLFAAGCQTQNHDKSQAKCKKLLHQNNLQKSVFRSRTGACGAQRLRTRLLYSIFLSLSIYCAIFV